LSKNPGIEVLRDSEGRLMYHYHVENFSEDRILLKIVFKDEDRFQPTRIIYMNCLIGLIASLVIGYIIYYIYKEAKKK